MVYTPSETATQRPAPSVFKFHQGKTFSFMGNTVIYKFNPGDRGSRIYEFWATATSKVPPLHMHPWNESFYFLEGTIDFQVGNQLVQAIPGSVIHLPAGVAHTLQVTSARAKFLVVVNDAAAERYVDDLAKAAQKELITPEDMVAIAQKHRIQFVSIAPI